MTQVPNVHDAEPIPEAAREALEALMRSGDLFRYTAPQNAPVSLLETEFAALMGSRFALAVSSCSAALFLSLKALDLPRDARVLIPAFTFAAVPSSVVHADCIPVLCEVADNYRVDLADLHAVCEANYARILRLFPDYEQVNCREFTVGEARVVIDVIERARYTTFFRVQQSHGEQRWLGQLRAELRVYHDARMAEVGAFQSRRRIDSRYQYPNRDMFQQDEKAQQNRFLAEWLEHCLLAGRSLQADFVAPGR